MEKEYMKTLNDVEVPTDIIDKGTIKEYKFYQEILEVLKGRLL